MRPQISLRECERRAQCVSHGGRAHILFIIDKYLYLSSLYSTLSNHQKNQKQKWYTINSSCIIGMKPILPPYLSKIKYYTFYVSFKTFL